MKKQSSPMPKEIRECEICGESFMIYHSRLKAGKGKFCSRGCAADGTRRRANNKKMS